ncbi:uncharacterized protein LOC131850411 [Achroia grisella]|uniref:uncharacterized protein LOC131850411 n=1 Tax=Achroia grisella TaxID=688607 RepID=UPI0027D2852F|nr:uncharacterized protein LOC131850411 [Achroia grisella]
MCTNGKNEGKRILDTLLYQPVCLLETLMANHSVVSWCHIIRDTFKLLTDVITKRPEAIQNYCEDIVKVCLLPFDSEGQKNALKCLERVARVHPYDRRMAARHVSQLENSDVVRTQLALIVGTICEFHPETVEDDVNRIWRIYLKMLESKKNSDTLVSVILQGLSGLFHSFGTQLPTSELNMFYSTLIKFIDSKKCDEVIITILEKHSNLFKERLSADARIRSWLWGTIRKNMLNVLRSVYDTCANVLDKDSAQNLLNSEVLTRAVATDINIKFVALRILVYMEQKGFSFGDLARFTDVHALEFSLRCGTISYDTAEEISWCIESNLPNSDKLLQTTILFYYNLPFSRRINIITHGILNSPDDIRTEAIIFLTTETIQPSDSGDGIQKYIEIWRNLVAGSNPASRKVLEDYVAHVILVLETFFEEESEEIPDRLSSLLKLTSELVPLGPPDAADLWAALVPLVAKCKVAAALATIAAVAEYLPDHNIPDDLCKGIEITRCKDEATLCASCLLLLRVQADAAQVLLALQVIFSRTDVEWKTFQLSLKKFEDLIVYEGERLDEERVYKVIRLVDKLRGRIDLSAKDGRVLHRQIVMFLGKYGRKTNFNNNSRSSSSVMAKLKDALCLKIPYTDELTMKINLQSVLEIAIEDGQSEVLHQLLTMLCADPKIVLNSETGSAIRDAVALLCVASCRRHAGGDPANVAALHGALLCSAPRSLPALLQFISEETSPGARKMLSELLGVLLQSGSDEVLQTAAERTLVMLAATDSTIRRAGLDITEILLTALTQNDVLTRSLLPRILELISCTNEIETTSTFDLASRTFIDKIALFDSNSLEKLIKNIMSNLVVYRKLCTENDIIIYSDLTKKSMGFIKEAMEGEKQECSTLFDSFFDVYRSENLDFYQCVYVLAIMKNAIGLNSSYYSNMFASNSELLSKLYTIEVYAEDAIFVEPDLFKLDAILSFFCEYAESLLELHYKKTVDFLSRIVKNITPQHVVHSHHILKNCIEMYKNILNSIPSGIESSFEEWCQMLPLEKITLCITRNNPLKNYITTIKALAILLNVFDSKPFLKEIQNWHLIIMRNYSKIKMADMPFLTDCLTVAVKYLTDSDVKRVILEGVDLKGVSNERIGVKFCTRFIRVFMPFLNRILLESGLEECCSILDDVVRFYVRKRSLDASEVVVLVDKLWPVYEPRTNFHQKCSLLYNMSCLPHKLGPDSNPLRWVAEQLTSDISREMKTSLVVVLPSGDGFSTLYAQFASSCLPATLCEVHGGARAALRGALHSLAANGNQKLFDIVLTLADGDDTAGWWDEAMDSCAASLARTERLELYEMAYRRCWNGLTLGVCERIMVPLLRYATPVFCERFFSTVIVGLLKKLLLKPRMTSGVASNLSLYHKCVVDRIRTLTLLQVAFEKIPLPSLQSPQFELYSEVEAKSKKLIREVCKMCVTLRDEDCPAAAEDNLRGDFKRFQYAIYNCLCAAICKRQPGEKLYEHILSRDAWSRIVDDNVTYNLTIVTKPRKTRHSVSIEVPQGGDYLSTSSVRTRMFLRTLSEDPLNYDLISHEEHTQVVTQDLELIDNELSDHPCSATLTALVSHVCSQGYTNWLREMVRALRELHVNMKWLLAQVIINCKDDLTQHASVLRPALLELIADTPHEKQGKRLLNGLHVDILHTLIQWCQNTDSSETEIPESSIAHLNTTIEYLINTTIDKEERLLLDLIDKLLEIYGSDVTVPWRCFGEYITGSPNHQNKVSLSILKRITTHKIHIPELVPTLVKYDKYWIQEHKMAELFGLAVTLESDKAEAMRQFKKILERSRQNIDAYVKILYYAQQGYPGICDERQFRTIVDQAPKVPKLLKTRCLQIIYNYISRKSSPDEHITSMFDTIELHELLTTDNIEAMGVAKNGLHLMDDGMKRRVVMIIAEYCHHPDVKVKQAAYEVMVKAFEDLLNRNEGPPPAKKSKKRQSAILNLGLSDPYTRTVLSRVSSTDSVAREVVSRLCGDDMRVRLAESILLCLYMPLAEHHQLSPKIPLLEMLFRELRSSRRFLAAKLRDAPLELKSDRGDDDMIRTASSKVMMKSATYQGTFRSYRTSGYTRRTKKNKAPIDSGIDVQITIDSILTTLLKFAETNTMVQQILTVEIFKALGHRDSLYEDVAEQLAVMLALPPCDVTPMLIQLARVTIDNCKSDSFQDTVRKLKEITSGTEGEQITKCLYEEVRLRCLGPEQFVLGSISDENDINMGCGTDEYSLTDLTSCFGRLSNWDDLTIQQKCHVQNSGLPSLWTDLSTFKNQLHLYEVTNTEKWFDKMVTLYKGRERDSERWLRELDRWPVKHFDVSAVTEAISWNSENSLPTDIQRSDCIAEWAARLQIRQAYSISRHDSESSGESPNTVLFRSHDLLWCVRANEMALPELALQCIQLNEQSLDEDDKPAWEYQKSLALRAMGLKRNDSCQLRDALQIAENNLPKLLNGAPNMVGFYQLILALHHDLNSLTYDKVQNAINNIDEEYVGTSVTNKRTLRSLHEMAMTYYSDLWMKEGSPNQDELLMKMADVLNRVTSSNPASGDIFLAIILNRLDNYDGTTLNENVARVLLDPLQRLLPYLDQFSREHVKACSHLFPTRILGDYEMQDLFDDSMDKYKKYFTLIRDPTYSLQQYCRQLLDSLIKNDTTKYENTFCRIREILDNPYAGSTYQLLRKQRELLYSVVDHSRGKEEIRKILKQLIGELKGDPATLRLSQLCPSLTQVARGSEWDACMSRLLSLGPLKVVKFDEQVSIFLSSIRRPALLDVLVSDGSRRRLLLKAGEPLMLDAAACRVSRLLPDVRTYTVTPMSEDSGLIEFLEDHKTIYSLVSAKIDLEGVKMSLPRAPDDELIRDSSVNQFHQFAGKVPAYTLRSALEDHSSSLQDFIAKKLKFQDTLASATVHTWLLGLGDRHLQNVLCSTRDGAVCCVDWGAALQYGGSELPPARLTRNLIAICDPQILESRIQNLMSTLRDSHKLFSIFIKMSYKWMGREFDDKFVYIEDILSGDALSCHITKTVIGKSERLHKEKYLKLLDDVLQGYEKKDRYSIVEQASCLLRHCTDPRILSVTRTNWEPWV